LSALEVYVAISTRSEPGSDSKTFVLGATELMDAENDEGVPHLNYVMPRKCHACVKEIHRHLKKEMRV
jgi:hypothetical protein